MTCNVFPPDARMASSGFMSTASIVSLISLARIPKEKTINAKMPGNTPTPNRPTNTTAKTRSGIVRNTFINVRTERYKDFDVVRSEEHMSELQSRFDIVCRLLLEKKKK